jgi:hypothetical protein
VPTEPGFSAEMRERSLEQHTFPGGLVWRPRVVAS